MISELKRLQIIAKKILADYKYIYDPDHKKNPPPPGYVKTEKGWSLSDKKINTKRTPASRYQKKLHRLSKSKNFQTRVNVAKNPDTHISTLHNLGKDRDDNVRMAVSQNPNTSTKTLKKMSGDKNK